MTKKIFWEDPYLTRLKTRVTKVNQNDVVLESTIFYALSGGQESDQGTIGNRPVLQARKEDFEIIYTLEENHGLKPGEEVEIEINWPRRYQLMRLHFAAEIILEIIYKKFPGIEKIGAHIAQEKARIDFKWEENFSPHLHSLAEEANQIVNSGTEIISAFSDLEKERRYWEIAGFSKVPCGGTHLKNTKEIGTIRLKRDNLGKGKQRILIYVETH